MSNMSLQLASGLVRTSARRDAADLAPVTVSTCGSLTTSALPFRVKLIRTAANLCLWEEQIGLL